jgi:alpha-glucosidase
VSSAVESSAVESSASDAPGAGSPTGAVAYADRSTDPAWWRSAVFYQVYPRSFADSNGDGIGDLQGLRGKLDYLAELGVDAIWLSPFFRSPQKDHGYDVSDPTDVDPIFGTLTDFDELVTDAHARGIKVTVDLVPNHFSDQHAWFQQALAAAPGSRERGRFIFLDGRGADGTEPPNNWPSVFGGPAWTRVADGQWYLHLFAPEQPDLNWENPEVPAEFDRIMRFWLDRGADGFRMDVAHGMAKELGLPDMKVLPGVHETQAVDDPRFNQPHGHNYLRRMRTVLDEYPGAMVVGEAWAPSPEALAQFVRPDELHLSFQFGLLEAKWDAAEYYGEIAAAITAVGAPVTWVLSNHDVVRHASRFGGGAVGAARGRAAGLVQLGLPGAAYLYQGDELGLQNVELPDEALTDPTWFRSGKTERGRDGERVPMPWSGANAPYGFTTGQPWLPMPTTGWSSLTAEHETSDPHSTLSLYRAALRIRHHEADLRTSAFEWIAAPSGCLAFRRGGVLVIVNMSATAIACPAGELMLGSQPLVDHTLPPDTAAWLRVG